jgi:hypothetical protein
MTTSMFSGENAFKYLLTYRFSQDHIELLFSCIRAQGGWNNNPNCLQLKYAMRKMLLRNTITASKNANCLTFSDSTTTIIPFFHSQKHKAPLKETPIDNLEEPESSPVACEQAHWEKGEPARNHALYSILPFSHLLNANQSAPTAINKLSTVKLTQGVYIVQRRNVIIYI